MSTTESSTKPNPAAIEHAGRAMARVHAIGMVWCLVGGLAAAGSAMAALPSPASPTRPVTIVFAGLTGFVASIAVVRHLWVRPMLALVRRRFEARFGSEGLRTAIVPTSTAGRWFERFRTTTCQVTTKDAEDRVAGRHEASGGAIETEAP